MERAADFQLVGTQLSCITDRLAVRTKSMAKLLKVFLWLTMGAMLLLFAGLVVWPTGRVAVESRAIANALRGAQSVTLEEFVWLRSTTSGGGHYAPTEKTIKSVVALPQQIENLERAMDSYVIFDILGTPCDYPHNRVKIVRRDGSPFVIEVCFSCSGIRLPERSYHRLPPKWDESLRNVFSSAGLALRTYSEYRALEDELSSSTPADVTSGVR